MDEKSLDWITLEYSSAPPIIPEKIQTRDQSSISAGVASYARCVPERSLQDRPGSGRSMMKFLHAALSAAFILTSFCAVAADYPAPKQGEWIAKDFKFHTGDTMPELRLHYTTVGEPTGEPVL